MKEKMPNQNAKTALKQMRMEVAADYGMSHEDIFDMIEHAHNNGMDPYNLKKSPMRKKAMSRKPSHLE